MPLLTDGLKKQLCLFQEATAEHRRTLVNVPQVETFDPSHMYYTSDTKVSNENLSDARNELHIDNGNTQLSLLLSYTHFLTQCAEHNQGKRNVVVLIGFGPGDHLPFLMKLFPNFEYVFIVDNVSLNTVKKLRDQEARSKLRGFFDSTTTMYRFISINQFMEEIKDRPIVNSPQLRSMSNEPDMSYGHLLSEPFESFGSPNCPTDQLSRNTQVPIYFISNYWSFESSTESNTYILIDLILQMYWVRKLNPTYAMLRYKPLNPTNQLNEKERTMVDRLTAPGTKQGQFFDYFSGYMFKIPKSPKQLESCFLITNKYTETMKIYHHNMRALIRHHNSYTRRVILYEDIFTRMLKKDAVTIPYSKLLNDYVDTLIQDSPYLHANHQHHMYYVSNSWDDTVAVYIVMCYSMAMQKTGQAAGDEYYKMLGIELGDTEKNLKVVRIRRVLALLIRTIMTLKHEENDYKVGMERIAI